MRIEFDPTNPTEAAAVRAILRALEQPTAGELGIVMHEAPTDDKWHNTTTYAPEPVTRVGEFPRTTPVEEQAGAPQTDANNEPHDPRIHSTPAKTNADGTWRAKRGVTADQVAAVRAERNLTATDAELIEQAEPLEIAPAQEQSAPPAPNAPVEEHTVSAAPTPPSAPPAPSADPIEQFAAEVISADALVSFLDVMKAITAAQKAGKVDTAKVKELCAAIGAGDSTMGLNGADKGELRVQFMALLSAETGE